MKGTKNIDAELIEALTSLESKIPDGYFDQFSRKLGARLEVEVMEGRTRTHTPGDDSAQDVAARSSALDLNDAQDDRADTEREENSGLHDIKQLASKAKGRISRRITTQSDVEESLIASSSALSAVVLPEPGKETKGTALQEAAVLEVPHAHAAASAKPAAAAQFGSGVVERRQSGFPLWAIGSVALVAAAAAAVAFVVMRNDSKGEKVAAAPQSATMAGEAPAAAPSENEPAPPADPAPSVKALATDDSADAEGEAEGQNDELAAAGAAADEGDTATEEDPDDSNQPGLVASKRKAESRARGGKGSAAPAKPAADEHKADKADHAKKTRGDDKKHNEDADSKPAKEEYKAPEGASLDEVLNSVTGGVDQPKETKKDEGPKKKTLDRRDVNKAMSKISSRAEACYGVEEFTGTVTIKFTVETDGSLTGVKATGKHAKSQTGECVAAAVKGAKFPAFREGPMSFSFPFLLSQP